MKEKHVYVLLVSATPFAEVSENVKIKKIVNLKPGANPEKPYYGVQHMVNLNRIIHHADLPIFQMDKMNTAEKIGKELEQMLKKLIPKDRQDGFIILRVNFRNEVAMQWFENLKDYLEKLPTDAHGLRKYTYFELNGTTCPAGSKKNEDLAMAEYAKCVPLDHWRECLKTASGVEPEPAFGLDAVLCYPPDRFVFIFVKEMLLAGKQLNTENVSMVIDMPTNGKTNLHVNKVFFFSIEKKLN
jgi:hypothetical protein